VEPGYVRLDNQGVSVRNDTNSTDTCNEFELAKKVEGADHLHGRSHLEGFDESNPLRDFHCLSGVRGTSRLCFMERHRVQRRWQEQSVC